MKLLKPPALIFIGILVLSFITTLSCKKSDNSIITISEDATVVDKGSIAADGCGWQMITKTDSTYVPQNLSSQFQINNLKVHITYHKLKTRYYCSQIANNPGSGITEIQLDAIITR
ncbi:MAG: hypothetical protein JWQ63_1936 [Mucilaginibacter sp.]|nr:hypothetical protein [Mucilaginibacter sp.]